VDGTGGSPNVTWTRTTTTPLVGTASFLFTKDAANRQGQGASYDFTIDSAYKAKVLQIQFEYAVTSGTFAAGSTTADSDITVWIEDVTNNVLIQPTTYKLFASSSLSTTFVSNFQTASNSTSYRLIFHVATTSASAYTVEFDDVRVSPSQYVYGTPITDWTTYTMTITGSGSNPTKGTPSVDIARWRRVGDSAEIQYTYAQAAGGTAGSGAYLFSLPSGLTLDTIKATVTTNASGAAGTNLGTANAANTTSGAPTQAASPGFVVAYNSTNLAMVVTNSTAITNSFVGSAHYALSAAAYLSFNASVPIAGWSSSVQTSDQADSRVVALQINSTSTQAITTATVTKITGWVTPSVDTHAGWSAASQHYVIPVSGVYRFNFNQLFNNVATAGVGSIHSRIRINGADVLLGFVAAGGTATQQRSGQVAGIASCRAGDIVEFFTYQDTGTTLTMTATGPNATIERLSQASLISATETVAARASTSAGQSISTSSITTIVYGTKASNADTHNAFNTSTGVFTAPVAGRYRVSATAQFASASFTATNNLNLFLYVNGAEQSRDYFNVVNTGTYTPPMLKVNDQVVLQAGQTVDIRISQDTGGSRSLVASGVQNYFSIERIGI
jgi:hypothetical protein